MIILAGKRGRDRNVLHHLEKCEKRAHLADVGSDRLKGYVRSQMSFLLGVPLDAIVVYVLAGGSAYNTTVNSRIKLEPYKLGSRRPQYRS